MAVNCPAGSINKMLPKAASLSCRVVLRSGMRLAQEAKQSPWQKKKADTAKRICCLEYVGAVISISFFGFVNEPVNGVINLCEFLKTLTKLNFIELLF